MAEPTQIRVLTTADLAGSSAYEGLADPFAIADPGPDKRAAMSANPAAAPADPAQVLAVKGGAVVGRLDLIPAEARIDGRAAKVFWGSNLYVPPEHRSGLTGVTLILKAQSLCPVTGAYGPSQMALPVYQKLKWADRPMDRWVMVRRSFPVVERMVAGGPLGRVVAAGVDVAAGLYRAGTWPLRRSLRSGLRTVRHDRTPPAFAAALAAARPAASGLVRTAEQIDWWLGHRFRAPGPRDRTELHVVESAGAPVAYVVVKARFHEVASHRGFRNLYLGTVLDWAWLGPRPVRGDGVGSDGGAGDGPLVALAAAVLARLGVDAVELSWDDPSLVGTLRLLGFVRQGSTHLVLRAGPGPAVDLSAWRVRPGDGDNAFI